MNEGFIPSQLVQRDVDRLMGYKELLDFYHGDHWQGYAKRGEKHLTFNYAKVVIDKVTSYVMSGINFVVEPVDDSDDTTRVWRVASKYNLTVDEIEILYKVKPEGKTANIVEVWTAQDFELWLDDVQVERKANPYGFIPFVLYPNLREPKKFWGISDLPQLMEPQRELNRAMSQLSRILELSGNPIAVLENVEESEDIAVKPGAVWDCT